MSRFLALSILGLASVAGAAPFIPPVSTSTASHNVVCHTQMEPNDHGSCLGRHCGPQNFDASQTPTHCVTLDPAADKKMTHWPKFSTTVMLSAFTTVEPSGFVEIPVSMDRQPCAGIACLVNGEPQLLPNQGQELISERDAHPPQTAVVDGPPMTAQVTPTTTPVEKRYVPLPWWPPLSEISASSSHTAMVKGPPMTAQVTPTTTPSRVEERQPLAEMDAKAIKADVSEEPSPYESNFWFWDQYPHAHPPPPNTSPYNFWDQGYHIPQYHPDKRDTRAPGSTDQHQNLSRCWFPRPYLPAIWVCDGLPPGWQAQDTTPTMAEKREALIEWPIEWPYPGLPVVPVPDVSESSAVPEMVGKRQPSVDNKEPFGGFSWPPVEKAAAPALAPRSSGPVIPPSFSSRLSLHSHKPLATPSTLSTVIRTASPTAQPESATAPAVDKTIDSPIVLKARQGEADATDTTLVVRSTPPPVPVGLVIPPMAVTKPFIDITDVVTTPIIDDETVDRLEGFPDRMISPSLQFSGPRKARSMDDDDDDDDAEDWSNAETEARVDAALDAEADAKDAEAEYEAAVKWAEDECDNAEGDSYDEKGRPIPCDLGFR